MPLIPKGIGGFADRVKERVKRELGLGIDPPEGLTPVSTQPIVQTQTQPPDPNQGGGFFDRVKQVVKKQLGLGQQQQRRPMFVGPANSLQEIKRRIEWAGRQMPPLLLNLTYHGYPRKVEGYSYRYRDADHPHIPLFFGWCGKDLHIEAYKLLKIQDVQVTNLPFNPRWPVEF